MDDFPVCKLCGQEVEMDIFPCYAVFSCSGAGCEFSLMAFTYEEWIAINQDNTEELKKKLKSKRK